MHYISENEFYEGGFKDNLRQGPGVLHFEKTVTYGYFDQNVFVKKGRKKEINDLIEALMGGRTRKEYEKYLDDVTQD